MGADKNYRVLLIEPLYQCEYENGKKIDKFLLNIKIELKNWQYKETIDVGNVAILDESTQLIECLKYGDGNIHHAVQLGGAEKYRSEDFTLPISEQAYKQAKEVATIRFIVAENEKRRHEELTMKDGLYSCAVASEDGGD